MLCLSYFATYRAFSATGHKFTNYVYNNDATCTANGTETATCDNGCGATDTREAADSATGHTCGEPTWNWAADGSSVTATFTCSKGDDTQVITASGDDITSSIIKAANESEEGLERFTATIRFGGATFTNDFDKIIPVITPDDPTDPTDPDDPTDPTDPTDSTDPAEDENLCKWCGKDHSGSFWQRIVGFIHSILYFFAHLFGRR